PKTKEMLRTIIIDDEQDSREALRLAVEKYCTDVELVAVCDNPQEGVESIKTKNPDLVFLDVQMPHMSGFDVLHQFPKMNFEVIFVTAHNHYAIKAIKFSALDYLLKPVGIDELQAAIKRASEKTKTENNTDKYHSFFENIKNKEHGIGKLSVPILDGLLFIDFENIIRCKADDNYTEIFLKNKEKIVVSRTLGEIEEMLEGNSFFRVHQTHLINLKYLKKYIKGDGGQVVMNDGSTVDVARRKKEEFLAFIGKT